MKILQTLTAFVIFGLFFIINIYTLNAGHNWGDDFAQYIQHAINLCEHQNYASHISLDPWIIYPPGFPLLLSSLIFWFGLNLKILKSLNILLWALSALAVYGLTLRKLDRFWARILTVWFLTSPFFFLYKQNILSDIPFMCFVLLTLWAFTKFEEQENISPKVDNRLFLLLAVFFMSCSFLIRWAGIGLFLAVITYFSVIKQNWKKSLSFILGAVICWFITLRLGASALGYIKNTSHSLPDWIWASINNMAYIVRITLDFFLPYRSIITPLSHPLNSICADLLFLGLMGTLCRCLYQRTIDLMDCFMFFYLAGLVFWPIDGGARYILPIVIPLTIYMLRWIKPAFQKIPAFIFMVLILLNIFTIFANFKFNDDAILTKDALEMMRFVELNIKPGEFYMFNKPRALGLFTQRLGASFWVYPPDQKEWYKRIKPLHIRYLIGDKQQDQFSHYDRFRLPTVHDAIFCTKIWENNRYKIFKVSLQA